MLHTFVAHVQDKACILRRVALLCATTLVLGGLGCKGGVIAIDVQDNAAVIHIETEGNYSTPIRSLRIFPQNNKGTSTFAVQGSFDFKIHDLPLHTGPNPLTTFETSNGDFRVTAPADGATTFNLQPNQTYFVEVCFSHGCQQNKFTMHE